MKLLQKKLDMMTANKEEMRIGTQAIIEQNQTLQNTLAILDTVKSVNEDRERRDGQILELQSQIAKLADRGLCVIL